jgi:hypothetical protein
MGQKDEIKFAKKKITKKCEKDQSIVSWENKIVG